MARNNDRKLFEKSQDKVEKFLQCLQKGLNIRDSLLIAEINEATYYAWLRYSKAEKAGFEDFVYRVARARINTKETMLEAVQKAANADDKRAWRAAAWLLEKSFPKEYGSELVREFQDEDIITAPVEYDEMQDEELIKMADRILSRAKEKKKGD